MNKICALLATMELARWQDHFLQQYRKDNLSHYAVEDDKQLMEIMKQDGVVYVISENNRAPYKIGYAKSDIYKRFLQFRTFARKFYIHFVIGFFTGAMEELGGNFAKEGENFLQKEFRPYRMHFPKYNIISDQVDDEGGAYSELFHKKSNGERITLNQIEQGIMRALDSKYTKEQSKFNKKLYPKYGYRCLSHKLERLKEIDEYVQVSAQEDLDELRAGQHKYNLKPKFKLTKSLKGHVKAHVMDNSKVFPVSTLDYTGEPLNSKAKHKPKKQKGKLSFVGVQVGSMFVHKGKLYNADIGEVTSQRNGYLNSKFVDPALSGSIDPKKKYQWYRVRWSKYQPTEYIYQQIIKMQKSAKENPVLA